MQNKHLIKVFSRRIYAISDLDSKYVFADLGLAQELMEYKSNQISGIEIKQKTGSDENAIVDKLQTFFKNKITVKNRAQLNEALYKMLNTENIAVYLIFTLVIVVCTQPGRLDYDDSRQKRKFETSLI
jgi:lipoprotein-releasing system permease protein